MNNSMISLDPSALSAFTASLAALPRDEVRKAKSLFIRNAIADYRMAMKSTKGFLIMFGIMSIIPIFLLITIPAFISYKAAKENGKQKIINALEVWKEYLADDYLQLIQQIEKQ